jgi:ZIP family zinc transporter
VHALLGQFDARVHWGKLHYLTRDELEARYPRADLTRLGAMGAALGWGAVAAASLVIGALLGLARTWSAQLIGLGTGDTVSVGLLVAIFVSNLPEAIGSSSDMLAAGRPRAFILRLWLGVAAICTVSTAAGFAIADATGGELKAAINGFAAGALLVMLVDSMIPEATAKVGRRAGLATVLGFALAAGLSSVS